MADLELTEIRPLVRVKMPDWVTQSLSELIRGGSYLPGARLPSEAQMSRDFGVSRTVIREAVSRLKSEGLVESRQGSGVFVREAGADMAFRIAPSKVGSIEHLLHVAELRRSVEAEIAALAAERATAKQIDEIGIRLQAIDADVAKGGNGVAADIEFHRSIARATGNPHFLALWDFLSHFLSGTIKITRAIEAQKKETVDQVVAEHRAIHEAIFNRDVEATRAAARKHIDMSSTRIRNIPPDFLLPAENTLGGAPLSTPPT
ncbi:FadR family transcriptional regulator [Noviherbaspirillum sp. L7-7A]|nr:FadR family transcriptional regulator [Noviherbaspirillum sp. L7-7A]